MAMTLLEKNQIEDARDWVASLGHSVNESDIVEAKRHGIHIELMVEDYVRGYKGSKRFMDTARMNLHRNGHLTQGQAVIVCQIMQEENGWEVNADSKKAEHFCTICGPDVKFEVYDDLVDHKIDVHNETPRVGALPTEQQIAYGHEVGEAVIADTGSSLALDLSNLPDGRYAFPDSTGKADNVFLMVKRVRRTMRRDRRYVYGKIKTGDEVVLAGTIEVKVWSSDSKELIGEQKPGDVYRGEREAELQGIMRMPEVFARLFGRLIGSCCICGKTLTDDTSKDIGMGLECEKKVGYFTNVPKSYIPTCPMCPEGLKGKPGRLIGFYYASGASKYKCFHDHVWMVDKRGNIFVQDDTGKVVPYEPDAK